MNSADYFSGWTDDLGGERAVSEGVCSACRAGEGEP